MNKISLSIFGIGLLVVFYFTAIHACAWSVGSSSAQCSQIPTGTPTVLPVSVTPPDTISPAISQETTLTPTPTAGASATPTQGPTATPGITPQIGTAASANNIPHQAPNTGFAPN